MGAGASVQQNDPNNQASNKLPKSKQKVNLKNSKSIDMSNSKPSAKKQRLSTKDKDKSSSINITYKQKDLKSNSTKLPLIAKNKYKDQFQKQKRHITDGPALPFCLNKNESAMICLSPKCNRYPFYCLECDKNCEQLHHHSAKVISTSCIQFYNKVISRGKRCQKLKDNTQRYRKCLVNLKKVVTKYIDKQIKGLQAATKQLQIPPRINKTQNSLQKYRYTAITGSQISQLWKYYDHSFQQKLARKIKVIQSKQHNTQKMSECFASINNLCSSQAQSPAQMLNSKSTKTVHRFKKYGSYNNTLDKQRSWSSNIQQ